MLAYVLAENEGIASTAIITASADKATLQANVDAAIDKILAV